MTIKKYGSGDGRILRDKKEAAKTEWTEQDQADLQEEQADALDGEDQD